MIYWSSSCYRSKTSYSEPDMLQSAWNLTVKERHCAPANIFQRQTRRKSFWWLGGSGVCLSRNRPRLENRLMRLPPAAVDAWSDGSIIASVKNPKISFRRVKATKWKCLMSAYSISALKVLPGQLIYQIWSRYADICVIKLLKKSPLQCLEQFGMSSNGWHAEALYPPQHAYPSEVLGIQGGAVNGPSSKTATAAAAIISRPFVFMFL